MHVLRELVDDLHVDLRQSLIEPAQVLLRANVVVHAQIDNISDLEDHFSGLFILKKQALSDN